MEKKVEIDEIKNSIVFCLRRKFPNAKFYKDGEVKSYPNFYITITDLFLKPISLVGKEMYTMQIFARVEYRESVQPSTVANLNSKLDDVGFKMLECLRYITFGDTKYFTNITNNEIADNKRIFEFDFTINVKYDIEQTEKMQKLYYKGVDIN